MRYEYTGFRICYPSSYNLELESTTFRVLKNNSECYIPSSQFFGNSLEDIILNIQKMSLLSQIFKGTVEK
jgi:hypothetical protein